MKMEEGIETNSKDDTVEIDFLKTVHRVAIYLLDRALWPGGIVPAGESLTLHDMGGARGLSAARSLSPATIVLNETAARSNSCMGARGSSGRSCHGAPSLPPSFD